jgi:hypothetical protein
MTELKPFIVYVLTKGDVFHLPESYWKDIAVIAEFLSPFSTATDIIQSDVSGIIDVFIQFDGLAKHCKQTIDQNNAAAPYAATMLGAIDLYWNKHMNQECVIACLELSKADLPRSELFSVSAIRGWKSWLINCGRAYLTSYHRKLREIRSLPLSAVLTLFESQLTQFQDSLTPFDLFKVNNHSPSSQSSSSARDSDNDVEVIANPDDDSSNTPADQAAASVDQVMQPSVPSSQFDSFNARQAWQDYVGVAPELSYVALACCPPIAVKRVLSDRSRLRPELTPEIAIERNQKTLKVN